jgi:hypothetical protein
MAIPIRSIPVLECETARRFEREARRAERERATIDISKQMEVFRGMMKDARERGVFK